MSTSDSESETALLNPASQNVNTPDTSINNTTYYDSPDSIEMNTPPKKDPLHILILYGLSFVVSLGGLTAAIAGYVITITAPLDKENKKWHRQSYETNFLEMQSIVVLLAINVVWTAFNFYYALKGRQDVHELVWLLNMIYDFFAWATLIAFGVLNMILMLWDRRLCDGWDDREMYAKCDIAMYQLLVVEMVAVNLGILAAVFHFILLIGRCCTHRERAQKQKFMDLQRSIQHEEQVLMVLLERRRQLVEETEELAARRSILDRPLPSTPTAATADLDTENVQEESGNHHEEDLIDMGASKPASLPTA